MHELIRDHNSTKTVATALVSSAKTSSARSNSYERCTNGQHNSKTAHSEDSCWQLHPDKNPHSHVRSKANVASITGRALCARVNQGTKSGKSLLDSGLSHHMFKDRKDFISNQPQETTIEVANGNSMTGLGVGTISGSHLGAPLSLSGALHVPELK